MITANSAIAQLGIALSDEGAIMLFAITSIVASLVALMGLGFGLSRLIVWVTGDESARVGGFYVARTPYKGYKRFHSQEWNMEHTV